MDTPAAMMIACLIVSMKGVSLTETNPRRYFGAILRRLANTDPDTVPAPTALHANPAERRGLLDDQRGTCVNPDCVGGMVGGIGPDGRPEAVHPCPDCHVLGATA